MARYIDADELKKQIIGYGLVREGDFVRIPLYREHCAKMWTEMLRWFCEEVDLMPTAEEVKRGRWEKERYLSTNGGSYGMYKCSVCGDTFHDIGYGYNYCPNCGAKMEEDK